MKKFISFFFIFACALFTAQAVPLSCSQTPSAPLALSDAEIPGYDFVKPRPAVMYTASSPAGKEPLLLWHTTPLAVYYELEFTALPPENPNATALSASPYLHTRAVYTNGYYADLRRCPYEKLYWRVRALDYDGNPIGVFSDAQEIYLNSAVQLIPKPIINTLDDLGEPALPLYPVYKWIPLNNLHLAYEVELLNQPPEAENNTRPSAHRIWSKIADDSSDCYDEFARLLVPGVYYWRVRAVDDSGNTVGVYSDTASFTVANPCQRAFAATYGDSITHGGGAVSYSPATLEYSYQTYLDFPALNLGKSGDTSTTAAERFERDVLPFHPKNLLILCGANSLRAGAGADTIIRDIREIQEKCLFYDIHPILLTLLPLNPAHIYRAFGTETAANWKDELKKVNAFIRNQSSYIDLEPYFYDEHGLLAQQYAIDGLHPDIKGKMLMAKIINAHQELLVK